MIKYQLSRDVRVLVRKKKGIYIVIVTCEGHNLSDMVKVMLKSDKNHVIEEIFCGLHLNHLSLQCM